MTIHQPLNRTRRLSSAIALVAIAGLGVAAPALASAAGHSPHHAAAHTAAHKPTIVLEHGAWADSSSWSAVTSRLQKAGYTVDVAANPLRGIASDARYLKDLLSTIRGPVVLVGHSYGGMVITKAATGNANVKALVYVDAFVPDQGDSVASLAAAVPGSQLDPATSINAVPIHDADGKVVNADLYIKPALFGSLFAGGIAPAKAALLAAGQRPLAGSAVDETFTGVPAWKNIPSWDLIGTADNVIPAAGQELMAHRAGAHVTEVDAPHLSMVADPEAVTDVIIRAARATN